MGEDIAPINATIRGSETFGVASYLYSVHAESGRCTRHAISEIHALRSSNATSLSMAFRRPRIDSPIL